jgi:hypothetical protein
MGQWFIPLESPFTAFHRELITAVGFQVEAGQDGTLYLTASELQGLSTREDAHPVAAELLDVLNGYMQIFWPGLPPLTFSWLLKREDDGSEERTITAVPSLFVVGPPGGEVEALLWELAPATAGYHAQRPRNIGRGAKLAEVRRALSIHGKGRGLWWALYAVYEIIRDDVGGWQVIVQREWSTESQLNRFRESANHPEIAGAYARHGSVDEDPRHPPMSLAEAKELVRMLLARWVAAK